MLANGEADGRYSAGPKVASSPIADLWSKYSRKICASMGLSRHQSLAPTTGTPTGGRGSTCAKYASAKYIAQGASRSNCATTDSVALALSPRLGKAASATQESGQLAPSAYCITTSRDTAGSASRFTAF